MKHRLQPLQFLSFKDAARAMTELVSIAYSAAPDGDPTRSTNAPAAHYPSSVESAMAATHLPQPDCNSHCKYFLKRGVFVCRTRDGAIFLDLESESYFGLGQPSAVALETVVLNWPRHNGALSRQPATVRVPNNSSEELARALVTERLLTDDEAAAAPATLVSVTPKEEVTFEEALSHRLPKRLDIFINYLRATLSVLIRMRFASLEALIRRFRLRRPQGEDLGPPFTQERARELSCSFLALQSVIVSRKGACMFDSLCLTRFLEYYGIFASIIIAVRTSPFEAHCWVQSGNLVLNDTVSNVEEFSPILILR
jgi:Transglutaminase-like superfamily